MGAAGRAEGISSAAVSAASGRCGACRRAAAHPEPVRLEASLCPVGVAPRRQNRAIGVWHPSNGLARLDAYEAALAQALPHRIFRLRRHYTPLQGAYCRQFCDVQSIRVHGHCASLPHGGGVALSGGLGSVHCDDGSRARDQDSRSALEIRRACGSMGEERHGRYAQWNAQLDGTQHRGAQGPQRSARARPESARRPAGEHFDDACMLADAELGERSAAKTIASSALRQ